MTYRRTHRRFSIPALVLTTALCGACEGDLAERDRVPAAPAAPTERAPGATRDPVPTLVTPGALDAVHEAYLEGDYLTLGERIRDVLLDPAASMPVKQNAYEVLDKAYEVTRGMLPSRFALPSGYVFLQYGATRTMGPNGVSYDIRMYGRARDVSTLVGLTVSRLPGQVLLDKKTQRGQFELRDEEPGFKDFEIEARGLPELPGDGVFTVRLEFDDGTVSEGWFIVNGLASSASPEVTSPGRSASLSDPNPLVVWEPFRSPEFRSYERRTMSVWVGREGSDVEAWNFWTGIPGDLSSVRVGTHPGAPKTTLPVGAYWLSVTEGELRKFGPVSLMRASRTGYPFHVVP